MIKKVKDFVFKNLKWIILFVCLIGFIVLAKDVFNKEIMDADIIGYKIISDFLISDFSTPIAKFITNFGSSVAIIAITVLLFVDIKDKKIGMSVFMNLCIITGLNLTLKNIVQRPRPTDYRIIDETGYSFPSGHSMISMAFYGFLIYLIYRYIKNRILKIVLITFLGVLIVFIGVSRIYLGVHYTSDVIAGFLISICYLIIYISAMNKFVLGRGNEMDLKENQKLKVKTKKLVNSFKYAGEGFIASFKSERNMKIHIFTMILVIFIGILLKISMYEWFICIICFASVIAGELFNTAIETVVDMVMPHKNEKAKLAKDVSAAAVLVLAIGALIIGLMIFIPKLLYIL